MVRLTCTCVHYSSSFSTTVVFRQCKLVGTFFQTFSPGFKSIERNKVNEVVLFVTQHVNAKICSLNRGFCIFNRYYPKFFVYIA